MTKTYAVIFPDTALPGVRAVGSIKRGDTVNVDAAEALRLVNAKGLRFVNANDAKAAQNEVTPPVAAETAAARPAADTSEEH